MQFATAFPHKKKQKHFIWWHKKRLLCPSNGLILFQDKNLLQEVSWLSKLFINFLPVKLNMRGPK